MKEAREAADTRRNVWPAGGKFRRKSELNRRRRCSSGTGGERAGMTEKSFEGWRLSSYRKTANTWRGFRNRPTTRADRISPYNWTDLHSCVVRKPTKLVKVPEGSYVKFRGLKLARSNFSPDSCLVSLSRQFCLSLSLSLSL